MGFDILLEFPVCFDIFVEFSGAKHQLGFLVLAAVSHFLTFGHCNLGFN